MTQRVPVELGSRSYEIIVGERLLAGAGEWIAPVIASPSTIIVTDRTVAKLYLHRLCNALEEAGIRFRSIILEPGESTKSLEEFARLMEALLEQKPDRRTTLIALGGGVIGDITGFAASVLLRGVNFIQIPTTLLAQVDSSVGGKTGINSRFGKNLIGSFHQPRLVLADVSLLSTLPRRELMAGYAEILKYGLIRDAGFFEWLESQAPNMLAGDNAALIHAVVSSCQAKATIVAADERESGIRALLNFGHTFGHALEAETGFSDALLHGEAVAVGMALALDASVRLGYCSAAQHRRVMQHYKQMGLAPSLHSIRDHWDIDALLAHMAHDKKNSGGALTFVLSRGIGEAFVEHGVAPGLIREVLAQSLASV
jgi:3-dehydroquinate synthase